MLVRPKNRDALVLILLCLCSYQRLWLHYSSCSSSVSLLRQTLDAFLAAGFTAHLVFHRFHYCDAPAAVCAGRLRTLLLILCGRLHRARALLLILLCWHQDVTETLADLPLALMLRLRFFTFRSRTSASSEAIRAKSSEMVCCSCVGSFLVLAPVLTMML